MKWTRNDRLVRGLDYYRHTAFEFVTDRLGAQGTVLAGGRYDGLIESLGGPHTPAVGWAAGIERLAMMIEAPVKERPDVAVVPLGEAAEAVCAEVARRSPFRRARSRRGPSRAISSGGCRRRTSRGARFAVLIGDDELTARQATVKNLRTGDQSTIAFDVLDAELLGLAEQDRHQAACDQIKADGGFGGRGPGPRP